MPVYVPRELEAGWESVVLLAGRRALGAEALGALVERMSRRYHGEQVELTAAEDLLARVRFWLPRDLPKVALPLAELALAGAFVAPARRGGLRVLDLGAGVGSTSLGLLRALAHLREELAPRVGEARAKELAPDVARLVAVDRDGAALEAFATALREARARGLLPAGVEPVAREGDYEGERAGALLGHDAGEPYDLVLAGTTLVEGTRSAGDEHARGTALAAALDRCARRAGLADDGSAVVLEPASRPEARALQRAREPLAAQGYTLFAPCTHAGPCPLLARERDWCHEDLAVDLPAWLAPVARAAGLRYQGLTFSYLTLRRDGASLRALLPAGPGVVSARVLTAPRATKGKTELFACAPGLPARWMLLDRDRKRAKRDGEGARRWP